MFGFLSGSLILRSGAIQAIGLILDAVYNPFLELFLCNVVNAYPSLIAFLLSSWSFIEGYNTNVDLSNVVSVVIAIVDSKSSLYLRNKGLSCLKVLYDVYKQILDLR